MDPGALHNQAQKKRQEAEAFRKKATTDQAEIGAMSSKIEYLQKSIQRDQTRVNDLFHQAERADNEANQLEQQARDAQKQIEDQQQSIANQLKKEME